MGQEELIENAPTTSKPYFSLWAMLSLSLPSILVNHFRWIFFFFFFAQVNILASCYESVMAWGVSEAARTHLS